MTTKVQKWGNSLAVRIPKDITKKLGLYEGSSVDILSQKEGVLMKPTRNDSPTLKEMVRQITPENRHKLIDWGEPVGKEVW